MSSDLYELLSAPFPNNAYNVDKSRGFPLIGVRGAFVVERLNKAFGLLGTGWRFAHSPFVDNGKEITTEVVLQYRIPSEDSGSLAYSWNPLIGGFEGVEGSSPVWSEPVYGVGGNQKGSGGVPISDAQKSAVSAGLSKAASRMGVGIDAYKGNLVLDGQEIDVKDDSTISPGDKAKAMQSLANALLLGAPAAYDKLTETDTYLAAHKAALTSQIAQSIKAANLSDFVTENLPAIVGDKSANSLKNLSAANLLLLNNVAKSIASGAITWKQALEIAEARGELTWEKAVSQYLKDDEKSDDDSK